jgi:hypothetical protein
MYNWNIVHWEYTGFYSFEKNGFEILAHCISKIKLCHNFCVLGYTYIYIYIMLRFHVSSGASGWFSGHRTSGQEIKCRSSNYVSVCISWSENTYVQFVIGNIELHWFYLCAHVVNSIFGKSGYRTSLFSASDICSCYFIRNIIEMHKYSYLQLHENVRLARINEGHAWPGCSK